MFDNTSNSILLSAALLKDAGSYAVRFHVRTSAYPYGNVAAYVTSGS